MKNHDLIQAVLSAAGEFRADWLGASGGKSMVPLPAHAWLNRPAALRVVAGAREAGATAILAASRAPEHHDVPVMEVSLRTDELLALASVARLGAGLLLATNNLHGALLLKSRYAVMAGTARFMRGALSEGPDKAKADFLRYARRLRSEEPHLEAVAAGFPPLGRPWNAPSEIPADSRTGQQLTLMREFSDGAGDGPTFARRWLAGRRHAMDAGERLCDEITAALDEVFYLLEDYTFDPTLQDEEGLTDEELRRHVAVALQRIRDLR